MAKIYTIDQLLALPSETLNALAAELRGWTISKAQPWNDGQRFIRCDVYNESDGAVMQVDDWTPVTNRNQSSELLEWFTSRRFSVSIGRDQQGITSVGISHSDYGTVGAHHDQWAMAETVAAIGMWLTMKKELHR